MTPSQERSYYAVSVVGPDRPGIVAGITEALYRLGCNIADSSCAMLASEFAMILIVSHPKPFTKAQLLDELKPACDRLGMTLSVRSLHGGEELRRAPVGEICQITVYGADQPGIVYRVTSALAARQINILDLQHQAGGQRRRTGLRDAAGGHPARWDHPGGCGTAAGQPAGRTQGGDRYPDRDPGGVVDGGSADPEIPASAFEEAGAAGTPAGCRDHRH